MKIGEKIHHEDNGQKLVIEEIHENAPYLKQAEILRSAGAGMTGENRLVGRIPMHLISQWLREAGLRWDDHDAVQDLIRRKMLSGDFDKFRVWEGTY
jgi:hypothetical protein